MTHVKLKPASSRSLPSRPVRMNDMETQTTSNGNGHAKASAVAAQVLTNTDKGWEAPIESLKVQKGFNVRKDVKPGDELVSSVRENGIQNPIHIRDSSDAGEFFVVDGERRFNAAKKAGLETVPVVYHGNLSDAEATALSLTTNENQKSLSPEERAEGFVRLKQFVDLPEIARIMGTSERTVNETIRALEKGGKEIKEGVKKGTIPARVGARAADLPVKEQKKVAKEVKGKSTKEGLKAVQAAEKRLGKVQRGRKPTVSLAKDAKRRVDMIEALIIDRLPSAKGAEQAQMLAHLQFVWMVRGDREVKDIYLADGTMAKLPAASEAKKKAEPIKARGKVKKVAASKKASAKKTTKAKDTTKKAASKKGARKGAR